MFCRSVPGLDTLGISSRILPRRRGDVRSASNYRRFHFSDPRPAWIDHRFLIRKSVLRLYHPVWSSGLVDWAVFRKSNGSGQAKAGAAVF
jgi:hypothetical protein